MRILITGKNSYIARKLQTYLNNLENIEASLLSVRYPLVEDELDFNGIDVFIHLSALVHKNEKKFKYDDYHDSNVKLTQKLVNSCIDSKVKHFIFFSSMAVYGSRKVITKDSLTGPNTKYGQSKLEAENYLLSFNKKNIKISIIRPPVVFGDQAPGNPQLLKSLSKFLLFTPNINNQKSVIFIQSLLQHVYEVIQLKHPQITHPQMSSYFSTPRLIQLLRTYQNKKTYKTSLLNLLIYPLFILSIARKAFSNQIYVIDRNDNNFSQLYEYTNLKFKDLYE
jgi:UDP-glucose 4-epimerase